MQHDDCRYMYCLLRTFRHYPYPRNPETFAHFPGRSLRHRRQHWLTTDSGQPAPICFRTHSYHSHLRPKDVTEQSKCFAIPHQRLCNCHYHHNVQQKYRHRLSLDHWNGSSWYVIHLPKNDLRHYYIAEVSTYRTPRTKTTRHHPLEDLGNHGYHPVSNYHLPVPDYGCLFDNKFHQSLELQ